MRQENRFESYQDVAEGLCNILDGVRPFFEEKFGYLDLGTHGSVYDKNVRDIEAFLRPLWGLGPYLTQNDSSLLDMYLKGIVIGTDPNHPNYWGDIHDFDQRIVEMASLSTFLILNKEKSWDCLSKQEQENLHSWLMQVNQCQIPRNNWHFFRVLVNCAMASCDMPFSQEMIDQDLSVIDSFYLGDGWYCDGVESQIDYYVSFAIHYYSLLYCKFVPEDKSRVALFKERAKIFAQTFKYWFSSSGAAVPFGRSLTYRFAQVSFFSALVFADVEALPWGEIKGLISRHLRHWMQQDIFTPEGLLSVGYYYQNLIFAEGYNAPGSPYWALKTFLLLAVPKDHPYWQATATSLTLEKDMLAHPVSKNFYQHNEDASHALMFPAGQFINYQSHASSKYSKFVYSTVFGNSVPKSNYWYYEGNFDNCLALSEDDHYFRTKELDDHYEIHLNRIIHVWHPWKDVRIKTTIVPLEGAHIRIHEVQSERELYLYDGGFSTPQDSDAQIEQNSTFSAIRNSIGYSKIENIVGYEQCEVTRTEPNTNLLYSATLLPYVKTRKKPGSYLLISLVTGILPKEKIIPVKIKQDKSKVTIQQNTQRIEIELVGGKNGSEK